VYRTVKLLNDPYDDVYIEHFYIDANGVLLNAPATLRLVHHGLDLVRAYVHQACGKTLYFGRTQDLPFIPYKLHAYQLVDKRRVHTPLFEATVQATTAVLRADRSSQPINIQSKWPTLRPSRKRIFKWVWSNTRDHKVNDFLWKIVHRRLPVGERRIYSEDVACPCGNELETLEHLFGVCSVARRIWKWFAKAWRAGTGRSFHASPRNIFFASIPPGKIRPDRKAYWRLFAIVQPEVLYAIWLQRCRFVYDDEPFSPPVIAAIARDRIMRACSSATWLHDLPGFNAIFDSFFDHLEAAPAAV
jgi:hypothetical protein